MLSAWCRRSLPVGFPHFRIDGRLPGSSLDGVDARVTAPGSPRRRIRPAVCRDAARARVSLFREGSAGRRPGSGRRGDRSARQYHRAPRGCRRPDRARRGRRGRSYPGVGGDRLRLRYAGGLGPGRRRRGLGKAPELEGRRRSGVTATVLSTSLIRLGFGHADTRDTRGHDDPNCADCASSTVFSGRTGTLPHCARLFPCRKAHKVIMKTRRFSGESR
jgi:hypothetical protein